VKAEREKELINALLKKGYSLSTAEKIIKVYNQKF
jgi:hypothetical protein